MVVAADFGLCRLEGDACGIVLEWSGNRCGDDDYGGGGDVDEDDDGGGGDGHDHHDEMSSDDENKLKIIITTLTIITIPCHCYMYVFCAHSFTRNTAAALLRRRVAARSRLEHAVGCARLCAMRGCLVMMIFVMTMIVMMCIHSLAWVTCDVQIH